MKSTVFSIIYFVILYLAPIKSFVELPQVDFNALGTTEDIVRSTTGNIFLALKLRDIKNKPRLKQLTMIHNVFAMITLRSQKTLKHIARLARVTLNKTTKHFIAQLNEVLDGDDKKQNENDLVEHTEEFLKILSDLKDTFGYKDTIQHLDVNPEILKVLNKDTSRKVYNTSNGGDSDENFLSDDDFWKSELTNNRRIFKGSGTNIKKFPFVASVQFFNKFQCGGSIIKSDLVITAASCLQLAWNNRFFRSNPAFLSVRVGSDYYNFGGENIAVLTINFHPMYNTKSLRNNLAILRLVRRINFKKKSKRVKKIDIDKNPWPLAVTVPGITVLGWGATSHNNLPSKNTLTYDTLDMYSLKDCQEIYSKDYVTQTNFCAGFIVKGGGACNHDVGGPGVSEGLLVGVMSFGASVCGVPDSPTVFTKLGFYYDWIDEIMEQPTRMGYKRTTLTPKHTILTTPALTTFTVTPYVPVPEPSSECDTSREPQLRSEDPKKPNPLLKSHINSQTLRELFQEFIATLFSSYEADDLNIDKKSIRVLETDEDRKLPGGNEMGELRHVLEQETTDESDAAAFVGSEEDNNDRKYLATQIGNFDPNTAESSHESVTNSFSHSVTNSTPSFVMKKSSANNILRIDPNKNFDSLQNVSSESTSEEGLGFHYSNSDTLLEQIKSTKKQMVTESESYLYLPNDTKYNNRYASHVIRNEIVDILAHANDDSIKEQQQEVVDKDDLIYNDNQKLSSSVETEISLEKPIMNGKKKNTKKGFNPNHVRAFSDRNLNKGVSSHRPLTFKFDWLNEIIDVKAA